MSSFDMIRLGPQPSAQLANLTPYQLRTLVLDYLCHQSYTKTAKAFARDSTVRHIDADGDEILTDVNTAVDTAPHLPEEDMKQTELRERIRLHILAGQVDEATTLLNEHFPSVLSGPTPESPASPSDKSRITDAIPYIASTSADPAHLTLNLRILSFIEACRTVPLLYPKSKSTAHTEEPFLPISDEETHASFEQQLTLLAKAQKLLSLANMLPNPADRQLYTSELKNVSGLLAYKSPERCSISKYLSRERREAVADQINSAILNRAGIPPVSSLELLARYTSTVWSFAHQFGAKVRPGAFIPPTASSASATSFSQKEPETVPPLDLQYFLDTKT